MKKLFPLLVLLLSCEHTPPRPSVQKLNSGTEVLLQAISIVDEQITWVSGHQSTVIHTLDGGESWKKYTYSEIDSLQFRDVHGLDGKTAVLMSAGPGALSRIFVFSVEAGWKQTYQMEHEEGFLNTIEFWDEQTGLAFGDSFNGELFVLKTEDGGRSWQRIDPKKLPAALEGEGGFAASGTCIATRPGGFAWVGTGAGGSSRVLHTNDYGNSWTVYESPLVKGDAAGITSIRMASDQVGEMVGGDLAVTDAYTANVAYTKDGGKNWTLTGTPRVKGAFYGSDMAPVNGAFLWVACGPNGMDYTLDFGKTWTNLDTTNLWAVDMHESGFGYASGKDGRLVKVNW